MVHKIRLKIPLPTITLLSTSLPNLLPMHNRSPGLHVSDIIRYICVKQGYFDESTELDMTRLQLGKALERSLISMYVQEYQGSCFEPGELIVDSIPGTPDMLWTLNFNAVHEFKYTDRSCGLEHCEIGSSPSPSHVINSDKFWKDRTQLACYCKMLWSLTGDISWSRGRLEVCHAKGDYSRDGKVKIPHNVWDIVYTQKELNETWLMMRSYKRLIEIEQSRRSITL